MSQLKLSTVAAAVQQQCGNDIVAAVSAQNTAEGKWEKAAKSLYKSGARVEHLRRDPKGAEFDESLETVVEQFIISAMTASRKPYKFTAGTFTFAEMLNLNKDKLRELDDKVISTTKRECIQTVGSRYGLMLRHLNKIQNPDGHERAKGNKKAEPAKAETDPVTIIRGWIANKTKMVDIANVDRFENALTEALVCLTQKR